MDLTDTTSPVLNAEKNFGGYTQQTMPTSCIQKAEARYITSVRGLVTANFKSGITRNCARVTGGCEYFILMRTKALRVGVFFCCRGGFFDG